MQLVSDSKGVDAFVLTIFRYLYAREHYGGAKAMVNRALEIFTNKNTLAFAGAVDLSGLIELDMNNANDALDRFKEAMEVRKSLLEPRDPLIASSLNNIALAYTELGEVQYAHDLHEEAIRHHLESRSDRIGNSYRNMSSLLLRMSKADEAEEMLQRCLSLTSFTDETFLNTEDRRFSGDMMLLSRIRALQNRLDDALRLASKALEVRQRLLGNGLKTCDSLYHVASLTYAQGDSDSAM